jgi:hypothetical protein
MRTLVQRGDTQNIKVFDKMVMELCPYLTPLEIDKTVGFMDRIQGSKWDINPTESDSITQLKLILGGDRYQEVKMMWAKDNQHIIRDIEDAKTKFIHKATQQVFDGLDPEDDPNDYIELKC